MQQDLRINDDQPVRRDYIYHLFHATLPLLLTEHSKLMSPRGFVKTETLGSVCVHRQA